MPLYDELLALASRLVGPPPPAVVPEADSRRAVSTAYYALFHRLIAAATDHGVPTAGLRPFAARNFEHRAMQAVCKRYSAMANDTAGVAVPVPLRNVAAHFVALQSARHRADYNVGAVVAWPDADTAVKLATAAFTDWTAVANSPAADGFLTELLLGGFKDR